MELWEEGDEELIGRPWEGLVLEALSGALDDLERPLRPRPRGLALGPRARDGVPPPARRGEPAAAPLLNRSLKAGGAQETVSQIAYDPNDPYKAVWAPSWRMVADPTAPERSRWQMFTGQSGHPASPHYDDLQADWLEGRTQPMAGEGPWRELDLVPRRRPGATSTSRARQPHRASPPARRYGKLMQFGFVGAESIRGCNGWTRYAPAPSSPGGSSSCSRSRDACRCADGPLRRAARSTCPQVAGVPACRASADVRAARPARGLPGDPGASQRCPSRAIGRRRAILVEPGAPAGAPRARCRARSRRPGTGRRWLRRLHRPRLRRLRRPLARTMSAWASSPYRAIGVYIGGANRACSQPNLTLDLGRRTGRRRLAPDPDLRRPAGADQRLRQLRQAQLEPDHGDGAGGRSGPRRGRRCAKASAMGPGSPIYFDMEAYTRTSERHRGDAHLPLLLDHAAARARLRLRRLQLRAPRASPTSAGESAAPTRCPTTSGPRTGTAPENTLDPYLPSHEPGPRTSASTSTAAATTRPTG